MLRILVVDDSPTDRALLVEILRSDPELQVVGEAKDGKNAVELARSLSPQLVTMDVHMPGMDGFTATKEIMITAPTPVVIITGSIRAHEVECALEALRAGALTVLSKPRGPQSPGFDESARKLVATLKTMAQVKVVRHWRASPPAREVPRLVRPRALQRGRVVGVATSTGGPAALHTLLGALPGDFAAPILVVQHITPGFSEGLAQWLDQACELRVKVAEPGEVLTPRTVYLAPDDRHLGVTRMSTVELSNAPPLGGFRPSGTLLFESLARAFGTGVVALILTGMGEDGVAGLHAVRQAGGRVLAQDENSCVVFGMPGAAVAAGLADAVLPLDAFPARLMELI